MSGPGTLMVTPAYQAKRPAVVPAHPCAVGPWGDGASPKLLPELDNEWGCQLEPPVIVSLFVMRTRVSGIPLQVDKNW